MSRRRRPREDDDGDNPGRGDAVRHDIQVTCTGSNIYTNGRFDVYNGSTGDWTCTDNFWGARPLRVLAKQDGNPPTIFDHQDDERVGSVTCRPFARKMFKDVGANLNPRRKPVTPPATKPATEPDAPKPPGNPDAA